MGTTSEKLTYLNTTKSLIKDNLNIGGANITTQPFRVYSNRIIDMYKDYLANGIDTIWNNWEKVNATNVETTSLSPTIKGKMKIDLKGNTYQDSTTGANKLPQSNYISSTTRNGITFTNNGDGTFDISGTSTSSFEFNIASSLGLETNKDYYFYSSVPYNANTFPFYISYYNGSTTKYILPNSSATIGNTALYQTLGSYIPNGKTLNAKNVKFMVVEGSVAPTDYEPYTGGQPAPSPDYPQLIQVVSGNNSIDVSDGTNTTSYPINLPFELCKIGDYRDRLFKAIDGDSFYDTLDSTTKNSLDTGSWYKYGAIGKVVLDGSNDENYIKSVYSDTNYCTFATNDYNRLIGYKTNVPLLSNYFINNDIGASIPTKTGISYLSIDYGIRIAIEYSNASDIAGFKTWLSTHNTSIYYPLATPTYTKITDTTLISQLEAIKMSYDDTTNISQTPNDLPFVLDVVALKEI